MPSVAVVPRVFVGARWRPLRVEAFAALYPEQSTSTTTGGSTVGARISGYDIGGRAAFGFVIDRFELGPTLGASVHHLDADAFGAARSGQGAADWVALRPGVATSLALTPFLGIRAEIEAEIALAQPEFVIANVPGRIHEPGQLSGCAGIGVELRFF